MASLWTPVNRFLNSRKRFIAVAVFLILLLILYQQNTRTRSKSETEAEIVINAKDAKQIKNGLQVNGLTNYDDDDENENDIPDEIYQFIQGLEKLEMTNIPSNFIQKDKCPACFGENLCEDISNSNIQINIPNEATQTSTKGVYYGKWKSKNKFVVIKVFDAEEFTKFDSYICRSVTSSSKCDLPIAILNNKSPVMQGLAFQPTSLLQTKQLIGSSNDMLPFLSCAKSSFVTELSRAYDADLDGKLTAQDIAKYYFSSVINPEPVLLQMLSKFQVEMPVSAYYGACGRVIVEEVVGQTLNAYLDSDWSFRVDLALQLLDLIDVFSNGDPDWGVIYGDFHFDNFAISEDDQIIVIDLEDIVIIDRKTQVEEKPQKICNWKCLKEFAENVMNSNSPQHSKFCSRVMDMGTQLMYVLACNLISDQPRHKIALNENSDEQERLSGLLHDPPTDQSAQLYQYLDDCITERSPGGRMEAVDGLRQLLETFSYDSDDEDAINDNGENRRDKDINTNYGDDHGEDDEEEGVGVNDEEEEDVNDEEEEDVNDEEEEDVNDEDKDDVNDEKNDDVNDEVKNDVNDEEDDDVNDEEENDVNDEKNDDVNDKVKNDVNDEDDDDDVNDDDRDIQMNADENNDDNDMEGDDDEEEHYGVKEESNYQGK